jgi:hypothetical protein
MRNKARSLLDTQIPGTEKTNNEHDLAPLNEHELGFEALKSFEQYARTNIFHQNIKLHSISIRKWESVENPDWKQIVIDFVIESPPEKAMALWDLLVDELDDFIDSQYSEHASILHKLLSLTVRW